MVGISPPDPRDHNFGSHYGFDLLHVINKIQLKSLF